MTNGIKRRQEQRYAVLKQMYDIAVEKENNSERTYFNSKSLVEVLPYPEQEIESALTYLKGQHLVEFVFKTWSEPPTYRISHLGIREIERSMQEPAEATKHFSSQIVQNFHGAVGAVQTGTHTTANVTQNIGADLSDVLNLLEQLKPQVTELPPEQQESALVSIEVLEDELKSQDENPKRIRGLLVGLGGIARGTVIFASQVAILAQQLKNLGVF